MDAVIERCAGLDVHKDSVVAAVRTPAAGGGCSTKVRSFGTFSAELLALRAMGWDITTTDHGVLCVPPDVAA